jgi:type VI secretion system protein ImpG
MSDELLPFYNRELSFLRRLGAEFADAHPKIAQRLRLGAESSEDPHVERFIQAAALLNARTRLKLDDDFPELTDALLGVLYPHYQLPIPSLAVVQLELDPAQAPPTEGHTVGRHAAVETEPIEGEPCRFRTGYPVTLWPLAVRSARLSRPPFEAPVTAHAGRAAALLKVVLGVRGEQPVRVGDLALEHLRFYLKGQLQHVFPLYQMLFKNVLGVAVAAFPEDPNPLVLGPECIRPVGFERDEGLLPYPARSFIGYRLLTEFFAFPEKFLFIDLAGWRRGDLAWLSDRLELYFFLDRSSAELEQNVTADTFRLGCTPVVNLYPQQAEPVALTQTETEYRVVSDARRPLAHEVYSIDRVAALSPDGAAAEYEPFFSVKHADAGRSLGRYWHSIRRRAVGTEERPDYGSEVYLSLLDLDFTPSAPAEGTLEVRTTCLNRDLPHRLPFGGDQPRLYLSEPDALVSRLRCLTAPTPTLRPALKHGALWKLISHLSLNHLSLEGGREGAEALREILKLYDFADSEQTRTTIAGVLDVSSRRAVARTGGEGGDAVCRGVEATIHFNEKCFAGGGLYLFASVLERFLALYATINSFTRLVATVEGKKGEVWRWPPRMGEKVML